MQQFLMCLDDGMLSVEKTRMMRFEDQDRKKKGRERKKIVGGDLHGLNARHAPAIPSSCHVRLKGVTS